MLRGPSSAVRHPPSAVRRPSSAVRRPPSVVRRPPSVRLLSTPINGGQSERLRKLHNRCARIIMNFKDEPGQSQMALDQLGWISLEERRKHIMARLMFKVVNNLAPSRISSMFQNSNHIHSYNLRGSNSSLFLPRPNTEYGRKCFRYSGVKIWNSIPEQVRNSESLNSFNRNISSVSLTIDNPDVFWIVYGLTN
jgi:hypothetical protein